MDIDYDDAQSDRPSCCNRVPTSRPLFFFSFFLLLIVLIDAEKVGLCRTLKRPSILCLYQ